MNKKRKILILCFIIVILISYLFFKFFIANTANILKNGNTNTSQEIVDDISKIKSYELIAEINIKSNKNENGYTIKQTYINPDFSSQEVIKPENIKGIKIVREKNQLKIENTSLNLTKIFQEYQYMSENILDLSTFIEESKRMEVKQEENEKEKILELDFKNDNPYISKKKLYIDKNNHNPIKMEIEDNNQNVKIHILYTEVKINTLSS